ncbi:MAG: NAD(P)H-dependent oxidoreductase, partial [Thermoleophilaceae bacterium]
VCTPEYAGALPGSFKNLLEWTVGDASTYERPVAWINASGPAAPSGGADAHESLSKVLGYVGANVVEAACARIPLTRDVVGADGVIADRDPGADRTDTDHVRSTRPRPCERGG